MHRYIPVATFIAWSALAIGLSYAWATHPGLTVSWSMFFMVMLLPRSEFNGVPVQSGNSVFTYFLVGAVVVSAIVGVDRVSSLSGISTTWIDYVTAFITLLLLVHAGYRVFLLHRAP